MLKGHFDLDEAKDGCSCTGDHLAYLKTDAQVKEAIDYVSLSDSLLRFYGSLYLYIGGLYDVSCKLWKIMRYK